MVILIIWRWKAYKQLKKKYCAFGKIGKPWQLNLFFFPCKICFESIVLCYFSNYKATFQSKKNLSQKISCTCTQANIDPFCAEHFEGFSHFLGYLKKKYETFVFSNVIRLDTMKSRREDWGYFVNLTLDFNLNTDRVNHILAFGWSFSAYWYIYLEIWIQKRF